jgi:hypothetical protein
MSHSRSPRKKKAKRRAEDPAPTRKGKKARASAEIGTSALVPRSDADEVPPRRSTRSGAGTGGRNARLEILGAVLEAPHQEKLYFYIEYVLLYSHYSCT